MYEELTLLRVDVVLNFYSQDNNGIQMATAMGPKIPQE